MKKPDDRPITIAMMALGGQGGGVLTGWLVETAEANGYIAQSTYVAGVAQRTGATVYCVEMYPREKAERDGQLPVFTPYPIPGDVDLVIAGEMGETGRAIEKGFVTPNVTTLVASSHRVYSMPEKEALGDGIMDMGGLADVAGRAAKRFICFDMQHAADMTGSIISSVLLGAIAASGALPFDRTAYEDVIRNMGKAVDANLRGFAAGFDGVGASPAMPEEEAGRFAEPVGVNGQALADRVADELPDAVRTLSLEGALRALDYQDAAYAHEYIDLLKAFTRVDMPEHEYALTNEVARQLALQMCYEDTIRVADLKTRADRFERIREQVGAAPGQPFRVTEYMHPRLEEFCDTLPSFLGGAIMNSSLAQKALSPLFRKGRTITTTSASGFLLLYLVSRLRFTRRTTLRYKRQRVLINEWLDRVTAAACDDYDYGMSIARSIEMVKGYGDTYDRGLSRYRAVVNGGDAATVRDLHRAALADEKGEAFEATLGAGRLPT